MSTSETITKTDLKNILEAAGNIGSVDSTPTPTASKVSEFDAAAQMNSTDMTSQEVTSFVEDLNIEGGGSGTSVPTANTAAKFDANAHMNSADMTTQEVSSFVGTLGYTFNLIDMFYPVGSYYETSDTTFNPNIRWGGTWVLETEGQVHVSGSVNGIYQVDGAPTDTTDGGASTVTLDATTIPAHTHGNKSLSGTFDIRKWGGSGDIIFARSGIVTSSQVTVSASSNGTSTNPNAAQRITVNASHEHDSVGGGQAHENMPPYIIVNRWHRTA